MLSREDLSFIQETLGFWKSLNNGQKKLLEQSLVKKEFHVGEFMRGNSEYCAGLFLILQGQVRAYIISESGKEITLYRLFDRDVCIFTASCILKNITFDIFIEVEKETKAFLIPTASFLKLSKESIAVQAFTNDLMASRFSEVMWIMEQALFTSFDKRLANYLLEQIAIEESDTLKITHERIANDLGTAREVVTRMLKYFQSEGIVELNRKTVKILDENKLYQRTQ